MYLRPVHSDLDPQVCHDFVKANPLGLLITHLASDDAFSPIQASHIPFVIDPPANGFPTGSGEAGTSTSAAGKEGSSTKVSMGRLRGHMARANPQVKALIAAAEAITAGSSTVPKTGLLSYLGLSSTATPASPTPPTTLPEDVLVIFTSPTHSYVTPTFYKETKPSTHKVVPTWDYSAVQVYGKLTLYNKCPETSDYLQKQVEDLTDMEERKIQEMCPGLMEGWNVGMAPESYVTLLKKGIVGVEIEISRIEGKFKLSQENDQGDWEGVVDGFESMGTDHGLRMAKAVEERGKGREPRAKRKEEQIKDDGTDHELSKASKNAA